MSPISTRICSVFEDKSHNFDSQIHCIHGSNDGLVSPLQLEFQSDWHQSIYNQKSFTKSSDV